MERPHLAHPANPRHRGSRHRPPGCGLPDALSLCRCRGLHQQRPEPDPGRAMEPHKQWFPASHQPPSKTARVGSRLRTLPAQQGDIRLAAQPRTAMALVPGPTPSQSDQPKATGHAGLVPAQMKPILSGSTTANRPSAWSANRQARLRSMVRSRPIGATRLHRPASGSPGLTLFADQADGPDSGRPSGRHRLSSSS